MAAKFAAKTGTFNPEANPFRRPTASSIPLPQIAANRRNFAHREPGDPSEGEPLSASEPKPAHPRNVHRSFKMKLLAIAVVAAAILLTLRSQPRRPCKIQNNPKSITTPDPPTKQNRRYRPSREPGPSRDAPSWAATDPKLVDT